MAEQWVPHHAKYVTVHALPGSYASRKAAAQLRAAQHTADALATLLGPVPGGVSRVDIYLSDPAPRSKSAVQGTDSDHLVRVLVPDSAETPISLDLVPLLIKKWFGEQSADCGIVSGIAGLVSSKTGENASLADCDRCVRDELAARHRVSPFDTANGAEPSAAPIDRLGGPYYHPAATSFVGNLVRSATRERLRKYVAEFDPARRDQSALAAFQLPLAKLEESWRNEMLRGDGGSAAIRSFVGQLWPLLRPYRWRQLETIVYMVLSAATSLLLPFASKFMIDIFQRDYAARRAHRATADPLVQLGEFALIFLALNLANSALSVRQAYVTSWIGQKLLMSLQERLFAKLQALPHSFHSRARVGDIMTRLYGDLASVQQATSQILGNGISQSLVLLAAVSVIVYQTVIAGALPLGVLILLMIPVFLSTSVAFRNKFRTAGRQQQKRVGEVAANIEENLSAHAVVKSLGLEKRASETFHERLLRQFDAGMQLVTLGAMSTTSVQLVMLLGQVLVLAVGGWYALTNPAVDSGHGMTLGRLILLTQLLPIMLSQISGLANIGQSAQMATGALERVTDVFDADETIADKPSAKPLAPLDREIRLDNIDFNYGGDRPILRKLSIDIAAGSHVAIVGDSGSGKSTIVNLLMRFWDPESGSVLFDGVDLRDVTISSLRAQIGLVFQDTFIFDTTLRDNIAMARPGATDAEVTAAAEKAQLGPLIAELPAGFDTLLGERGSRLSGGQRQRLAIARAILRDPRILILDEATSALDARTEAELLATLAEVAKGRTSITITHRLAMAAGADEIFVIEAGTVIQRGTHAQLSTADGVYRSMWEKQTGAAESAGARQLLIAARLRSAPLFAKLGDDALTALAGHINPLRFSNGDFIVKQGDDGDRMFLIGQGAADVIISTGDGGERVVNQLREGDFFGEMALFDHEPRSASVRAAGPVLAYSLMRVDFEALLAESADIRDAIAQTVASRQSALASLTTG